MPALVGRAMEPADYEPGASTSCSCSATRPGRPLNGDPKVLSTQLVLNGTARTLIGVMPPRFAWGDADLWIPEKPSRTEQAGRDQLRATGSCSGT